MRTRMTRAANFYNWISHNTTRIHAHRRASQDGRAWARVTHVVGPRVECVGNLEAG